MRNGGSTAAAERTFRNALGRRGATDTSTIWRSDFAIAAGPAVAVQPAGVLGVQLARAAEAVELGERLVNADMDGAHVAGAIERIKTRVSPYNLGVSALFAACAGAFFSRIAGGDWGAFGVTSLAAGAGQFVRILLEARSVPRTPLTAVCALISALIGTAGLRLGLSHAVSATLLGSVVYMIPGLALINGFIDAVSDGYLLVGIQRLLDAVSVFLIMAVAVAIADAVL